MEVAKLKSDDLKRNALRYFLYQRNFIFATTEMWYNGVADVIAISRSEKVYEVEIKTSMADLMSELRAVEFIKKQDSLFGKKETPNNTPKYSKHFSYLTGGGSFLAYSLGFNDPHNLNDVPHMFYFMVTPELENRAIEATANTPYGVMDAFANVKKQAKALHSEPLPQKFYGQSLRKLSMFYYENKLNNLLRQNEKNNNS